MSEGICNEANRIVSIDPSYITVLSTVRKKCKFTNNIQQHTSADSIVGDVGVVSPAVEIYGIKPTWTPYNPCDLAWIGGSLFGAVKVSNEMLY